MHAITDPHPKSLVIAGGSSAGTTLAAPSSATLPAGWQVVLLSQELATTFNPMLAGKSSARASSPST